VKDDANVIGAPEWVLVGLVKRIHGREGEVLVKPLTDYRERFEPGSKLYLSRKRREERIPVLVVSSRPSERGPLIKLEGYNSRAEADELFGASLFVPGAVVKPPPDGSYFAFQLEGCEVYAGSNLVGIVTGVHESPRANPYLEIDAGGEAEPIYIPFVRQVVLCVNLQKKRIDIPEDWLG